MHLVDKDRFLDKVSIDKPLFAVGFKMLIEFIRLLF